MTGLTKTCTRCNVSRPRSEFHRRGKHNNALDSWCNPCKRASHNRWADAHKETLRRVAAETRQRNRVQVIEHYGGKCACCAETELAFLAVDHINGGGNQHRKTLGHAGLGNSFYRWIIKQGYPPGFRVLCHNCNMAIGFYGYCPHQRPLGAAPMHTVDMVRQQAFMLTPPRPLACDGFSQDEIPL